MKAISFYKRSFLYAMAIATPLFFSQCGGSEDYKENEGGENIQEGTREENQVNGTEGGEATYSEEEAMYPEEKVLENTNLTDDQPLELQSNEFQNLDRIILLASLNRQKTLIEYHIRKQEKSPGNTASNGNNLSQLRTYLRELDESIARVRAVSESELEEVSDAAQATIQGAGALMTSNRIDIQTGF